ncbi:MAG: 50S ribosomal protein L25 [Acidimicrobiales bacterium]
MPEIVLQAEVGRPTGSRAARRLRRAGRVPGTVYGHGADPLSVAVDARELRDALGGAAGTNALLSLKAGGKTLLTLARELQRDPVRGTLTHVDLVIVRRDEVITAEVPLNLVGEAVEVHHGDGMVEQQLFTLQVRALPADVPNVLELDISGLTIGSALRVSDLVLPHAVSTEIDLESIVVVGQPPRVEAAESTEAAGAPEADKPSGADAAPSGGDEG